jgi:hypothetical protein
LLQVDIVDEARRKMDCSFSRAVEYRYEEDERTWLLFD